MFEPVPTAGLVGRLLGRVPREAAFVEIRNILASKPFVEVRESEIADALAKATLLCRDATSELSAIFEQAALLTVVDREVSDADRRGLAALQRAFELTDEEAAAAIECAVSQAFERTMREALADGVFTPEEKKKLEATSKALGMSDALIKKVHSAAAIAAVQAAYTTALADRRFTTDEEAHVTALATALGVTMKMDEETKRIVARSRLMAHIEDGDLPTITVRILLQRGEACHFAADVAHHEMRTVTKRINYSGPMASIKIMKGLRWRIGSVSVQRVTRDVLTQLDTGRMYLTSKRIIVDGSKKNVSIPFGKITKFTVFKDGLQIEKASGRDVYLLGEADWELAGACLDAAAKKLR